MQLKKLVSSKLFVFIVTLFVIGLVLLGIKNMMNSTNESFDDVSITATCPSGYKQFTDKPGNNLCCAGTVNNIDHVCDARTCTLNTSVENPNKPGSFYETCTNRNYEVVDKFSYRLLDGPASMATDFSYGDKIKNMSFTEYQEKKCNNNPTCGGAAQHKAIFSNKTVIDAYSTFPAKIDNKDIKNFIYYENKNPFTLPNGTTIKSTIHYKKY